MKDLGRFVMSASAKAQSTVRPPVLLCRLCHCEFTDFKEHVKSLVHLDARETNTTFKSPTNNKRSYEDSTVNTKRVKTEICSEGIDKPEDSTVNTKRVKTEICSEGIDKPDEIKNSLSESKTNSSIDSQLLYDPFSAECETDSITETVNLKKEDDTLNNQNEKPSSVNLEYERREELLSKKVFLEKHWHCILCDCLQHSNDGSFDEHAQDKNHVESLACKPFSRQTSKEKDCYQWLINCSACALETNDEAQFISHLQTKQHNENVRNILKNAVTAGENGALRTYDRTHKSESQVSETHTNSLSKQAPSTNQRNTNSKSNTPQADANRSTPGILHQGRNHGGRSTSQSVNHNPSKSTPKPLMSLSLPENWNKNNPGWNSTSAVSRNLTPTNKRGLLGDRPDSQPYKIGFNRNDRQRSTDLRSNDRQDSLLHSRSGPTASFGRPLLANPRDTHSTKSAMSSQRNHVLPSSVSLDFASTSSFRLNHRSKRDAVFDCYLASRSDVSRSDFSRNDFARSNTSVFYHYSEPIFSPR